MDGARPPARRLLIVWWSNTGGTAALVDAATDGARRALQDAAREPEPAPGPGPPGSARDATAQPPGVALIACRCDRVAPPALLAADALLFATPECLGSMAGPLKTFFDRCYYPVLDRLVGRPYATMVCAGTDGDGAIRQIERIATGWRLRKVAQPLRAITGAQTPQAIRAPKSMPPADLARAAELGATLAVGIQLGVW
jgi:hypothetical protein